MQKIAHRSQLAGDSSPEEQPFGVTYEALFSGSPVAPWRKWSWKKRSLAEARLEDSGGGYWFTGILMIFF